MWPSSGLSALPLRHVLDHLQLPDVLHCFSMCSFDTWLFNKLPRNSVPDLSVPSTLRRS